MNNTCSCLYRYVLFTAHRGTKIIKFSGTCHFLLFLRNFSLALIRFINYKTFAVLQNSCSSKHPFWRNFETLFIDHRAACSRDRSQRQETHVLKCHPFTYQKTHERTTGLYVDFESLCYFLVRQLLALGQVYVKMRRADRRMSCIRKLKFFFSTVIHALRFLTPFYSSDAAK